MSDGRAGRAVGGRIIEVKRRLDGTEERFDCELVHGSSAVVVVCFRVEDASFGLGVRGPLDSYGLFWPRRPYNCYHMVRPHDGEAVVTRFDVVRDVELDAFAEAPEVRYTDLLLDLRVAGGVVRWEDVDEVAEATRAGLLKTSDRARIARGRAVLERGHVRVAREVRRLLRSLGRLPA